MSEKLHSSNEQLHEPTDSSEVDKPRQEQSPAEEKHQESHDQIEAIRKSIETHATKTEEIKTTEEADPDYRDATTHRALKESAYKTSLSRARSNMSGSEQLFSKLIHRPGVEKASEIGSKTVARPSGLLGGGLAMLLGSTTLLFTAKHYGFTYSYSVIIILFIGGFLAGLFVELLLGKLFTKKD